MFLKIITSNIRFDNPKDIPHDWQGRREILSAFINSISPDLLGTQEGLRPQIYDLHSLISPLKMADQHREWIVDRMYPTIFHSERLEYLNSGDIWLSETPQIAASKSFQSAFPRLCTWSKFKINQKKLLYVNTHLDHLLTSTRVLQAKVLASEISKIHDCDYLVLTGDFNDSPTSDVHKILIDSLSLSDPWIELGKEEKVSHHDFHTPAQDGARIDWILVSKNIECKEIELYDKSTNGLFPSDHYPVWAKIDLK